MQPAPLRLGIVGTSSVALRSVIPAAIGSDAIDIVAVGARDPLHARSVAERFGISGSGTYQDLCADAGIDAVYISVPTGLHAAVGGSCIDADKHVLLEKTFAATAAQAHELLEFGARRKVVTAEALMYLEHPHTKQIFSALREGRIGEVRHVDAAFGYPFRPEPDIRYRRDLGGGATLDALVYPLSFCLALAERAPKTWWSAVRHDTEHDIDVGGVVAMDFGDWTASLVYGMGLRYRNAIRVLGSTAELTAERVFTRPPDLAGAIRIHRDSGTEEMIIPAADHFRLMLERFAARVRSGDPDRVTENAALLQRLSIITDVHTGYLREHPDVRASSSR
jgi:NDP-hexose-3-ketoreductase